MKDSDKTPELLLGSLAIAASVLGLTGCTKRLSKYESSRQVMGTFATISAYDDNAKSGAEAINAAFARISEIEGKTSIFDTAAEAFRLNRDGCLDNPSPDLLNLLKAAREYYNFTAGSFDITIQPLLELWDSGKLWQQNEWTQQDEVYKALRLVGMENMSISDYGIYFNRDGMKITLGGIAKGYAAGEAIKVLEDRGIENALVNIGGDMSALGSRPDGKPWQIALVNPDNTNQQLAAFGFADKSIVTSGNYQRYFTPDKKVHHIIDPGTGYSANECISVSIITADGTLADTLATTVFVMGPQTGLELVESLDGAECLLVDSDRVIHKSSGISEYLG